ncbi:EAL domain-containing protein [Hankyongella ginsenosidimutans]|uniref:EAL domain-containing protein n=1 Tax=Hankyongella ginsenosidimutans TaxID=1763828 RepID=A0A4D7C6J4_9SPHN|nr:EAL domain-containing protein [Hankyongella ginsenosidimutans]
MSALQSLPIRELKIDRSFVLDMLANPASDVIVRSTVDLAHNLGMRVVAEGVETRDHYNRLRQLLRTSRRVISSRFR